MDTNQLNFSHLLNMIRREFELETIEQARELIQSMHVVRNIGKEPTEPIPNKVYG